MPRVVSLVINYWILPTCNRFNTQYGFRWPQIGSMALAGAGPTASTWRWRAEGRYRGDIGEIGEIQGRYRRAPGGGGQGSG